MENTNNKSYGAALVTLTSLFFMWGFITCLNDLLIPSFKDYFNLSNFQANLVQFAFFTAYFVISLLYFIISSVGFDPIKKYGYKNTLVAGLLIAATACFLFFMEASSDDPQFGLFLFALFLLGTGFSFLQIAANPLVAVLGTEESASSRLNLSQAFNSLGTTFSPAIGAFLIYNYFKDAQGVSAVQMPYLILASVLLILSGVLFFSNVPNKVGESSGQPVKGAGALKHPYLVFGMIGIFCYVGAEVAIGSNLTEFIKSNYTIIPNIGELLGQDYLVDGKLTDAATTVVKNVAAFYLMFYWGGAMTGRFMGSISMSNMPSANKYLTMAVVGILSTSAVCLVAYNSFAAIKPSYAYIYFIYVVLNYIVFVLAKSNASRTLGLFAIMNVILIAIMLCNTGFTMLWVLLAVGLFNSIMFSNVFTLSIEGLKEYTSQGSSLLVMMILGGALVPPLQGLLADLIGPKIAFAVPMVCYVYLAWFGFVGSRIGKKKKIVAKTEEHPESVVLNNSLEG